MKIKEIEIYAIHLPLHEPFIISYGRYDTMPSIIVKMTTDTGQSDTGKRLPTIMSQVKAGKVHMPS